MKTILVIYTDIALSSKQISNVKVQKYAFRTEEDLKVGDIIESKAYSTNMQITDVIDNDYKYFNIHTGELRNEINSTKCYPIKTIVLREDDNLTVYANKVETK